MPFSQNGKGPRIQTLVINAIECVQLTKHRKCPSVCPWDGVREQPVIERVCSLNLFCVLTGKKKKKLNSFCQILLQLGRGPGLNFTGGIWVESDF